AGHRAPTPRRGAPGRRRRRSGPSSGRSVVDPADGLALLGLELVLDASQRPVRGDRDLLARDPGLLDQLRAELLGDAPLDVAEDLQALVVLEVQLVDGLEQ